ncbi:MAG: thiamine S protein [Thermoplasmata archaeon]|nr:MAG: thiamine S protein [Thermoplasmata archaeon]
MFRGIKIKAKKNMKISRLLEELDINREEVIVFKKGEICVEEEEIRKGEEIEILKVVSGG